MLSCFAGTMPDHVSDKTTSALVTYIHNFSKFSQRHPGVEFLLSTFESWRRSVGHYPKRKFDLVAIATEFVGAKLQEHPVSGKLCQVVSFDSISEESLSGNIRVLEKGHIFPYSQCWIITHSTSGPFEWSTYPFAHDIVHLATRKFMSFASTLGYEMLAKVCNVTEPVTEPVSAVLQISHQPTHVDNAICVIHFLSGLSQVPVGTIVTPTLPTYIPERLTFSRSLHLWQEDTRIKLQQTADSLLLRHNSSSEIGDVWIGHAGDVVALAAAVNEILTMVVERSFSDQKDSDFSVDEWLYDVDWEEQERFSLLLFVSCMLWCMFESARER
jgi:hypothetical protein